MAMGSAKGGRRFGFTASLHVVCRRLSLTIEGDADDGCGPRRNALWRECMNRGLLPRRPRLAEQSTRGGRADGAVA
jgi:hypothetical protein